MSFMDDFMEDLSLDEPNYEQEIKPEIPLSNTQNIFKKIETQK